MEADAKKSEIAADRNSELTCGRGAPASLITRGSRIYRIPSESKALVADCSWVLGHKRGKKTTNFRRNFWRFDREAVVRSASWLHAPTPWQNVYVCKQLLRPHVASRVLGAGGPAWS